MRIGIDIDNTIVKTEVLASKLYKKLYKKDFFKLGKIDQYIFCGNHPELLVETEFFPNFKKVIKKLNEKHEIYFITARSDRNVTNIEKDTIKLLEDNNIKYDGIFFGCHKKLSYYNKLNLDLMIDDDYDVYNEIKNNGNIILFEGCLNKSIDDIKFNNWIDILDYIERDEIDG